MTRVLSAAVLIALIVATIWYLPPWVTVALAALVSALAAREVAILAAPVAGAMHGMFVALAAGTVTATFALRQGGNVSDDALIAVLLAAVVFAGALVLTTTGENPATPATFAGAAVMLMGPIYVGLPLGAVAWMHMRFGPGALTWFLAVIAVSDSAQYYVGRAFGRRLLAPLVSPKKTVEGAVGGLVGAVVAGAVLQRWWLPEVALGMAIGVAFFLAAAGMVGDLFESLLKRSVGVKDAGALIPGHGGALDRVDSYLFAAPLFYLFLRYLA
jgi:phosphatidate cytidylyltransferase